MLTFPFNKNNHLSQESYNTFICTIPFFSLTCPCCSKDHCFIKHAYYQRSIKTPNGITTIRVLRVICKECGKTHAIFPSIIVPYSQILLNQHMDILTKPINELDDLMITYDIDYSHIKYIHKQFHNHWQHNLAVYKIVFDKHLIFNCFKYFNKQFMQIKNTMNVLFIAPT